MSFLDLGVLLHDALLPVVHDIAPVRVEQHPCRRARRRAIAQPGREVNLSLPLPYRTPTRKFKEGSLSAVSAASVNVDLVRPRVAARRRPRVPIDAEMRVRPGAHERIESRLDDRG